MATDVPIERPASHVWPSSGVAVRLPFALLSLTLATAAAGGRER